MSLSLLRQLTTITVTVNVSRVSARNHAASLFTPLGNSSKSHIHRRRTGPFAAPFMRCTPPMRFEMVTSSILIEF